MDDVCFPPFRVSSPSFFGDARTQWIEAITDYMGQSGDPRDAQRLMNELQALTDGFGAVFVSVNPRAEIAGYMGVLKLSDGELEIRQWHEDGRKADVRELSREFIGAVKNYGDSVGAKTVRFETARRGLDGRLPARVYRVLARLGFSQNRTVFLLPLDKPNLPEVQSGVLTTA